MSRSTGILVTALALALSVAGLSGCGQKGKLYLPTDPASAGRATLPQTLMPGKARAPASAASTAAPARATQPVPPPPGVPDTIDLE